MSGELGYRIYGHEIQFVEMELAPGQGVIAEAGSMMYMDHGIEMDASLGDGSKKNSGFFGSILGAGKRVVAGESLFVTTFTNKSNRMHKVAFNSTFPGVIVPVSLRKHGGSVLVQRHAFLCATRGVSVSFGFVKRLGATLFGGEGLVMQKLTGDGTAFMQCGGSVMERELQAGEVIYVDTGSIVGYQPSVDFNIQAVRGIKSVLFAGESFFLASLKGPGTVWIQSMPYNRFLAELANSMLEALNNKK